MRARLRICRDERGVWHCPRCQAPLLLLRPHEESVTEGLCPGCFTVVISATRVFEYCAWFEVNE